MTYIASNIVYISLIYFMFKSTKETCRGNYVYNDPSNTLCSNNLQRVDEVHIDNFDNIFGFISITSNFNPNSQFQCTREINLSDILEPLCDDVNPAPDCPVMFLSQRHIFLTQLYF